MGIKMIFTLIYYTQLENFLLWQVLLLFSNDFWHTYTLLHKLFVLQRFSFFGKVLYIVRIPELCSTRLSYAIMPILIFKFFRTNNLSVKSTKDCIVYISFFSFIIKIKKADEASGDICAVYEDDVIAECNARDLFEMIKYDIYSYKHSHICIGPSFKKQSDSVLLMLNKTTRNIFFN